MKKFTLAALVGLAVAGCVPDVDLNLDLKELTTDRY